MDLKQKIAGQKQSWIIAEGVVVLLLLLFFVVYAFIGLNTIQADAETYQKYGDNAARADI